MFDCPYLQNACTDLRNFPHTPVLFCSVHTRPMWNLLLLLLLLPFNSLFSRPLPERQNQSGFKWGKNDGVLGWQLHQLDHIQTICTSFQIDNNTNTSSVNFYRPDALPGAPPASKHWKQCYAESVKNKSKCYEKLTKSMPLHPLKTCFMCLSISCKTHSRWTSPFPDASCCQQNCRW